MNIQTENLNKNNIWKDKNHRAEEYNNWTEKFNRVVQHQTKLRRKDQWTKAMGNEKKEWKRMKKF